jgi:hypothetical protein
MYPSESAVSSTGEPDGRFLYWAKGSRIVSLHSSYFRIPLRQAAMMPVTLSVHLPDVRGVNGSTDNDGRPTRLRNVFQTFRHVTRVTLRGVKKSVAHRSGRLRTPTDFEGRSFALDGGVHQFPFCFW